MFGTQAQPAASGGLAYQGTWNASTNTPTLVSSVGTAGDYYVVSVAGSTNLNGITTWGVGDWAIFNGSTWQKIDNSDDTSWQLNGNTLGAKKTLGSIDNQDIGIITNNTEYVTVLKTGKVGIHTTAPTYDFEVNGGNSPFQIKSAANSTTTLKVDLFGTADRNVTLSLRDGDLSAYTTVLASGAASYIHSGDTYGTGFGITVPTAKVSIKGAGATSATVALDIVNSTGTAGYFNVDDAGHVTIGNAANVYGNTFELYGSAFMKSTGSDILDMQKSNGQYLMAFRNSDTIDFFVSGSPYSRFVSGNLIIGAYETPLGYIDSRGKVILSNSTIATSGTQLVDSEYLSIASNYWNGSVGTYAEMKFKNVATSTTGPAYKLSLVNNSNSELFSINQAGAIHTTGLPTSNAGLSAGDWYVDTAANVLANGDKVIAVKQ